jgi:putative transposase
VLDTPGVGLYATWILPKTMPRRNIPFINGQFYHIYNRGVEKRNIFAEIKDFERLLIALEYYQYQGPKPKLSDYLDPKTPKPKLTNKIVEIICYCFMPNHFHIALKQLEDGGIFEFISKVSNSYTKYYNTKYHRVGPLFQGEFKAVFVESDEQLLHLTRYIHLNPLSNFLVNDLSDWHWSSYFEYTKNQPGICSKEEVLNFFPNPILYEKLIMDQADYAQSLELV